MGPLHKQKWDDPLSSVGDYRGMIEIKTAGMFKERKCCWEAKDGSPASTALKQLLPKINELFQTSGNRVPDSAMVLMDIFMMGESAEQSVPYIMFSCPNTCKRARIEAMNLVRRSGLLKEFPGLKVFHWEFPPHIPDPELTIEDSTRMRSTSPEDSSLGDTGDKAALEVFLIATYNGKVDISTAHKSTIGAIVRFGKCSLYFTAAHMLLLESNIANQGQSRDDNFNDLAECDSDYFSGDDSAYESEDNAESTGSSSMGQRGLPPSGRALESDEHSSSRRSPSLHSGTGLFDTPNQCDKTPFILPASQDPHFANGEVFFKSHELDFALLDLSNLEVPPHNIPELNATTVSTIRAGFTDVVAHAGSRRTLHGRMSGRPSYIRFPHGGIYQEVYPVFFTDVQIGDSGSMVRDASTGKIYGHIVVASIASRTAFIVPAVKVLRAIPWLTKIASPVYEPLDNYSGQFRLVRLLPPSSSGDGICCELFHAGPTDRPEYEALSHVWGEQEEANPILLNGQPWDVRPVLAAALRRLRHKVMAKCIWIDALCIDRTNSHERSIQSQHIKEVFARSKRCLIWLGDVYDEPSSWAFSLAHPALDQFLKAPSGIAISYRDAHSAFGLVAAFEDLHKQKEGTSAESLRPFVTLESQRALSNLMGLPWWKNFWTFQDAAASLSASVICGTMDMTLASVGRATITMRNYLRQKTWRRRGDTLDFDIILPFLRTVGRLQIFQRNRVPDNFTFVMNSVRDLVSLDPRDKVFDFLNRFHDVEATYGMDSSYSIHQICEGATVHQLLSTKTLFSLVRTTEVGRSSSLPSWVPDWSASIGSKEQFHSELSFLMSWEMFDASGGKNSLISIDDHTLHVQGLLIDRVSSTYSLMESGIDLPALIIDLASQLGGQFRSHSSKLVGKRKTSQKISPTVLQDGTHGSHRKDFWRLLTSDIRTSRHDVMEWRRARDSDWKVCLSEYRNGVLGHGVRGRMPFSTEKRYVGLGPAEMRVGDVVVVLYGGRFPFVLRPTVEQKYNLVGYAYVSGIMDGEAVSAFKETQTFQIV